MLLTSCVRFSLSVVHRKSPSVLVFTTDDAFTERTTNGGATSELSYKRTFQAHEPGKFRNITPQRCDARPMSFGGISRVRAWGTTSILAGNVPSTSPSASTNEGSAECSRSRHSTVTHSTNSIVFE